MVATQYPHKKNVCSFDCRGLIHALSEEPASPVQLRKSHAGSPESLDNMRQYLRAALVAAIPLRKPERHAGERSRRMSGKD